VAPDTIVGRQRELAPIRRFFDDASLPRTLLIEGEAGIGLTTIWTEATNSRRSS
jgi:predicted ATPase